MSGTPAIEGPLVVFVVHEAIVGLDGVVVVVVLVVKWLLSTGSHATGVVRALVGVHALLALVAALMRSVVTTRTFFKTRVWRAATKKTPCRDYETQHTRSMIRIIYNAMQGHCC